MRTRTRARLKLWDKLDAHTQFTYFLTDAHTHTLILAKFNEQARKTSDFYYYYLFECKQNNPAMNIFMCIRNLSEVYDDGFIKGYVDKFSEKAAKLSPGG